MALPPCHTLYQFYAREGELSLQLYQRSADAFLGVPFNIASYSLLLMMVANVTGLEPKEFVHTIGDAHIYLNHVEQMRKMVKRKRYDNQPTRLVINTENTDIDGYKPDDFDIVDYKHQPHIKLPIAV